MLTYHNVVKQSVEKRKILECVSVAGKINFEIINEEVKGNSSEAEEIKIRNFRRNSHVDI